MLVFMEQFIEVTKECVFSCQHVGDLPSSLTVFNLSISVLDEDLLLLISRSRSFVSVVLV